MSQNGYKQFFKTAREVKKGENAPSRRSSIKGPKVSDVLRALKQKRAARDRNKVPLMPLASALVLLVGVVFCIQNLDRIENYLDKVEIRAMGLVNAEDKKENSSQSKGEAKENSASVKSPDDAKAKSLNKDFTSEQLAFFNKLEERKLQLDQKEKELQKLEEELQEQKLALEKRLRELEDIRTKISNRLDEKVKIDQEKVDKLVEFYSNMKPQNAAKVFEDIDEDLAVEILNKMKKKSAADIMNLLKSDKAQRLSEKFAGYKRQ